MRGLFFPAGLLPPCEAGNAAFASVGIDGNLRRTGVPTIGFAAGSRKRGCRAISIALSRSMKTILDKGAGVFSAISGETVKARDKTHGSTRDKPPILCLPSFRFCIVPPIVSCIRSLFSARRPPKVTCRLTGEGLKPRIDASRHCWRFFRKIYSVGVTHES